MDDVDGVVEDYNVDKVNEVNDFNDVNEAKEVDAVDKDDEDPDILNVRTISNRPLQFLSSMYDKEDETSQDFKSDSTQALLESSLS